MKLPHCDPIEFAVRGQGQNGVGARSASFGLSLIVRIISVKLILGGVLDVD